MSDDTKTPSVAEQVLCAVEDKLAQAGYPVGPDAFLSPDMSPRREEAELRPDGTVLYIEINVTEHHHNTLNNNGGTVGNMAGERIENSQADVHPLVGLPPDLAKAFTDFEHGIGTADVSDAQKGALRGQIGVLKEEAQKSPDARNPELVSGTLDGLKLAAAATEAGKALWDTFGGTISGFFS